MDSSELHPPHPAPTTVSVLSDASVYDVGSAGAGLLAAMFRFGDDGRSVTELAEVAGVPKATASRTATRLIDAGLIYDRGSGRERQLMLNRASPHLDAISNLLWLTHGVTLAPASHPLSTDDDFGQERWTPFAVPVELTQSLPLVLRSEPYSGALELPGEHYDGPDLSTARAAVLQLRELRERTVRFEAWLQKTYYTWGDERDLDLIRLTANQGSAAWQAERSLMFSSGRAAQGGHVGRLAWAHAVYCVDAEARWLGELGRVLDRVGGAGTERRETDTVDRTDVTAPRREVAGAREVLPGFRPQDGTSGADAAGSAGERLLSVQALAAAETYAEQAKQMAAHPSFDAWRVQEPHLADRFPLASYQQV